MLHITRARAAKVVGLAAIGTLLLSGISSASATPITARAVTPVLTLPIARVLVEAPPVSAAASAAAAIAAKRAAFSRFTLRSAATRDMVGIERSLYRGRFYSASAERVRLCIVRRESEGHYRSVSPSRLYYGAYQVSRPLARGVTWMLLREHRVLLGARAAKLLMAHLRTVPMNRWPRYWQDAAFFTIYNWEHAASGSRHWAGGRWRC
jgi:hypothetical protein